MGDMMAAFGKMQTLLKDENFRNFISHPKVRELFGDPEIAILSQSRDFAGLFAHPKLQSLMTDPEIRGLISKLDLKQVT